MFKPNRFLCLFTAVAVVMTLAGAHGTAAAGGRPWIPHVDELPGMTDKEIILYTVGLVAVVVAVVIIAKAIEGDGDKKAEEGKTEEKKGEDSGEAGSLRSTGDDRIPLACSPESEAHLLPASVQGHPVNLILGIAPDRDGAAQPSVAIGVEVAF